MYPESPEHIKDFWDYFNWRNVGESVDVIVDDMARGLQGSGVIPVYCGGSHQNYKRLVEYFKEQLGIQDQPPAIFNLPTDNVDHVERRDSFVRQVAEQIAFGKGTVLIEGHGFVDLEALNNEGYFLRAAHDLDQDMLGYANGPKDLTRGFALALAQQFGQKLLVLNHIPYEMGGAKEYKRAIESAGSSAFGKLMSVFDPSRYSFDEPLFGKDLY